MRPFRYSFALLLIAGCAGHPKLYHFPARTSGVITPGSKKEVTILKKDVAPEVLIASVKPNSLPEVTSSNSSVKKVPLYKEKKKSPAFKRLFTSAEAVKRSTGLGDLDQDLKFAIIFSVAGFVSLVLMVLAKIFGIMGGIGLIIGVVFFTKWLLEQ
jgi:hypothetical protein